MLECSENRGVRCINGSVVLKIPLNPVGLTTFDRTKTPSPVIRDLDYRYKRLDDYRGLSPWDQPGELLCDD